MDKRLVRVQWRMMVLCWLVYAVVYFGRLNLSIALPGIQEQLGVGKSQVGLISTLFFWCYGFGQLGGGVLGDRLRVRGLVFFGLCASALCNLLFALSGNLLLMCMLWAANGLFQSLIWGPIVKTIARWIPDERRSTAVVAVSTSMVGGFLLAWGVLGQGLGTMRWPMLFAIPSLSMFATGVVWVLLMRDTPAEMGFAVRFTAVGLNEPMECPDQRKCTLEEDSKRQNISPSFLWQLTRKTRLWLIILACFGQAIVRDGITLWAPTMFMETYHMDLHAATRNILLLPAMNFAGILASGWLSKRLGNRVEWATGWMFLAGVLFLGGMVWFGGRNPLVGMLLMGLASAMMYGVNTLLMGVIPLQYEEFGLTSTISGMMNFLAYMASGIAAALTGLMVDLSGWQGVMLLWGVMALMGTSALFIHDRLRQKDKQLGIPPMMRDNAAYRRTI